MTHRLLLVCQGSTEATRRAAFPVDEPLDEDARAAAVRLGSTLRGAARVLTSPARAARETADAIGLRAEFCAGLREPDYGRWSGRTLEEIAVQEPQALSLWLSGEAAPHGGEAVPALVDRAAAWLSERAAETGRCVAVANAAFIRAAVAHVLEAPASSFWRVDVEPLSVTAFSHDGRRWALRAVAQPKM